MIGECTLLGTSRGGDVVCIHGESVSGFLLAVRELNQKSSSIFVTIFCDRKSVTALSRFSVSTFSLAICANFGRFRHIRAQTAKN